MVIKMTDNVLKPYKNDKLTEFSNRDLYEFISKLKKYPLILMDKNTVSRRSLDRFFENIGVTLPASIEVGSWDLMKRLVIRGMGVGVIPREYAKHRLDDGSLFEVKTDPVLPARSVGMLLPKDRSVSYALHCFLDYFREQV